jgi:hypothetical protein
VVRLEPFDDNQVDCWLTTWNKVNPARQLPVAIALAQGELARQPLLLFLLALFNSGGGALTPGISRAQLYLRLFTTFVERDVSKLGAQLSDHQRRQTVQRELDRLSMVAFAMFNRGSQAVTDAELVADLAALPAAQSPSEPRQRVPPELGRRAVALSIAEQTAGRFFFRLFVQQDQAIRGQQTVLSTFEFLHASFGEFLVGLWVVAELSRLAEQERRKADDLYREPPDDALLHALLSVAVLSTREQRVLEFMAELLADKDAADLTELRKLVTTLFCDSLQIRRHDPYPQYQPVSNNAPTSYAAYSANLILLLLLIAEAEGTALGDARRADVNLTELYVADTTSATPGDQLARFHAVRRWRGRDWRASCATLGEP